MIKQLLRRLGADRKGVAITELGFVAPPFFLILMAGFDQGHTLYMQALLQGELQKAARDSTLQSGSVAAEQDEIDEKVRAQLQQLHQSATLTLNRSYFRSFDSAANPDAEPETDNDGVCEAGESYTDVNSNGQFDASGIADGQGGARDVVIYQATLEYERLFPLYGLLGQPQEVEVVARTVLANQPYSAQSTPTVRNCT